MQWYEILCLFFALSCIMGALVVACWFDYQYKIKKLEFEQKKEKDLKTSLSEISFILNEINNNIYIKNKE